MGAGASASTATDAQIPEELISYVWSWSDSFWGSETVTVFNKDGTFNIVDPGTLAPNPFMHGGYTMELPDRFSLWWKAHPSPQILGQKNRFNQTGDGSWHCPQTTWWTNLTLRKVKARPGYAIEPHTKKHGKKEKVAWAKRVGTELFHQTDQATAEII